MAHATNTKRTFDPAPLIDALRGLLGDRCSVNPGILERHGHDESYHPAHAPDVVVFPDTTEEVAAIVKLARKHNAPVVPFGVGTSLEGHVAALEGGVTIDMSRMNKVVEVNADDLDVLVEAGVTRKQLNNHLRDQGLFFPIDPGADATIGGMTSTRASGTNAVRYGTMRENVLGLTVVTAEGKVIRTSRRARKSSAGYDLTRVFVGSEGTLGVITEVTVRIYPQPEAISAAVCSFPSVRAAVDTTIATIQLGIPIARCELLDALTVKAVNAHSKLGLPELPMLLFEFHGSATGVREQAEAVQAIVADHDAQGFQWASTPEERSRLWSARHNAYFACLQLKPGARAISTDVCVPISRLAECIMETTKDIEKASMPVPLFGHVGDGNFHLVILVDPASKADMDEAKALNLRVVKRALAMEGTCTGEHGIGIGKQPYLLEELGEAVDLMRDLKRTFDPDNLFNPGKLVPM
jgi:D-lactate dehydrogenase (cytochrome)